MTVFIATWNQVKCPIVLLFIIIIVLRTVYSLAVISEHSGNWEYFLAIWHRSKNSEKLVHGGGLTKFEFE